MKTHIFLRLVVDCSIVLFFSISSFAQAPPQNFSIDPHTSMATWDAPVSGQPNAYEIYLGDSLLAILDNTVFEYQINCLVYNDNYISSIYAVYENTISDAVDFQWTSTYLYTVEKPFAEGAGQSVNFSLKTISPCGTFASNNGLIGFNIYKNSDYFMYIPYEQGNDEYVFATDQDASGIITYCAESLYDLTVFGLPGETATSAAECQTLDLTIYDEIPFLEDWQSGSFETNNWTTDSENWAVKSSVGNDSPSVSFHRSPIETYYSYSLTSSLFDANDLSVGHIVFKFDLKLDDATESGTEFLKLKVKDSMNWITLDSISNSGSFDWTTYTFNIEEYTIGHQFQIAFEAEGNNSLNIMDWFIDNIEIYRECDPPANLFNSLYWNDNDDYGSIVEWDTPNSVLSSEEILHYGSLTNFSAVGLDNEDSFITAIRYDNLNEFEGDTIYSINYFINENGFDDIIIKVWKGSNASNEIRSDTVDPIIGTSNEYVFSTPIVVEPNTEYWFGYKIVNCAPGTFPAGCNAGPAVIGYGDKVKLPGNNYWDNLSDLGLDYNWNISVNLVHYPDLFPETLLGYNIYRSSNVDTNYQYIDFVNSNDTIIHYRYFDNYLPEEDTNTYSSAICFKVNAVWAQNNDTCISEFGTQLGAPWNDETCIMILGDNTDTETGIKLYPNPVKSNLKIITPNIISEISIYNISGQLVKSRQSTKKPEEIINVSDLKSGIYFIKIQTDKRTITKNFIKQ